MVKKLETALPLIDEGELELIDLPHISMNAISKFYTQLEKLPSDVVLYRNNVSGAFISGKKFGEYFVPFVSVACKKPSYPGANIPSQLTNWVQVAMVNADKLRTLEAHTRATYELISKHYDLVSDRKQYWAAKNLWKSLARSNSHIYVWDGNIKDYLRDTDGKPHKYDGQQNIPEATIWGKTTEHARRLLVATHKQLI